MDFRSDKYFLGKKKVKVNLVSDSERHTFNTSTGAAEGELTTVQATKTYYR